MLTTDLMYRVSATTIKSAAAMNFDFSALEAAGKAAEEGDGWSDRDATDDLDDDQMYDDDEAVGDIED